METVTLVLHIVGYLVLALLGGAALYNAIFTVPQSQVGIITRFGRFQKIAFSGLNFKIPFVDRLMKTESLQNRSGELKFQAVTSDQANVSFNALLIYSALNNDPSTIENIAFKFRSDAEFGSALVRTIEGEVRAFVATKKQAEILGLRTEIVDHVKEKLDATLSSWGFHLSNLQINDISFGQAITASMEKVVASANLKIAATNEGDALLITKTKAAEAEGAAIRLQAQAEKDAAKLRGEGIAKFREEVSKGMKQAATELGDDTAASMNAIMFSMYMENLKEMATNSKGNVFFFDGSVDNYNRSMKQLNGFNLLPKGKNKTEESNG